MRGDAGAALGEIPQIHQQLADPIEGASHGVAPALDRLGYPVGLPAQPPPAFRPPCMVLPIGAAVAGVRAHLPAQLADPLLLLRGLRDRMPLRGRVTRHSDPHGGGKVLAGLGVASVEVSGQAEGGDRVDRVGTSVSVSRRTCASVVRTVGEALSFFPPVLPWITTA